MTDFKITYLGTSGSSATASRGLPATFVVHGSKRMLFDCGEGTARQFERAGGMPDLDTIFITHSHTDHIMGLPGVLNTYALRQRERRLKIYGPMGTEERLAALFKGTLGKLTYKYDVYDVAPHGGGVYVNDLRVSAFKTIHTWNSVGWVLEEPERPGRFDVQRAIELGVQPGPDFGLLQRGETVFTATARRNPSMAGLAGTVVEPKDVLGPPRRGRKVVISGDAGIGTFREPKVMGAILDADLLIHEATFTEEERSRALATNHSTAAEAAKIACVAGVRDLSLIHIGTRYQGREQASEARGIFTNTIVPDDFYVETIEYND